MQKEEGGRMGAPNLTNWICDIYARIDADGRITENRRRQYRDEIHWCYRLGYMTHDEYFRTLEYLDTQADLKNAELDHLHDVRMAQIQYDQRLIADEMEEHDAIRDLFRRYVRYDKHVGLYYYGD